MTTASRIEWLEDRITQMGHEPSQYEQWHAELKELKAEQPPKPIKVKHWSAEALAAEAERKAINKAVQLERLQLQREKAQRNHEQWLVSMQQKTERLRLKLAQEKNRDRQFGEVLAHLVMKELGREDGLKLLKKADAIVTTLLETRERLRKATGRCCFRATGQTETENSLNREELSEALQAPVRALNSLPGALTSSCPSSASYRPSDPVSVAQLSPSLQHDQDCPQHQPCSTTPSSPLVT